MGSPKRKPLLSEVSARSRSRPDQVGVVTTPACTGGRKLISNGFDTDPKASVPVGLMSSRTAYFNTDQSFTASAYNERPRRRARSTAYGYCIKSKVIGGSIKKFAKKLGDRRWTSKPDQDGNPNRRGLVTGVLHAAT